MGIFRGLPFTSSSHKRVIRVAGAGITITALAISSSQIHIPRTFASTGQPGSLTATLDSSATYLDTSGRVWAWGANSFGEMGAPNATAPQPAPSLVPNLQNVMQVSGGYNTFYALESNGSLWAWGHNLYGEMGNGTVSSNNPPSSDPPMQVQVTGVVRQVAAGGDHALALMTDGTVQAWGYNFDGEVGNGTTTTTGTFAIPAPTPVIGLPASITQIAAGGYFSMALASDGSVWVWGAGYEGELAPGVNSTTNQSSSPMKVAGLPAVKAIAAGDGFAQALDTAGNLWGWGRDDSGQVGNGAIVSAAAWPYGVRAPVQVTLPLAVSAISPGYTHALITDTLGNLWTWGSNFYGELGNGSYSTTGCQCVDAPSQVPALTQVISFAGGDAFSLALVGTEVWAWGYNSVGEWGNGGTTPTQANTPTMSFSITQLNPIPFPSPTPTPVACNLAPATMNTASNGAAIGKAVPAPHPMHGYKHPVQLGPPIPQVEAQVSSKFKPIAMPARAASAAAATVTAPALPALWVNRTGTAPTTPSGRYGATEAPDPKGFVVLFGGTQNPALNPNLGDTWLWIGGSWHAQNPATSPAARHYASMSYDPGRQQTVLFGGLDNSGNPLGDTWIWNGTTWFSVTPSSSPSAREGASAAYDSALGAIVLFGGRSGTKDFNDLWAWNGSTWKNVPESKAPPARAHAAMAYAPGGLVVMGGDCVAATAPFADTWTLTGTSSAWVAATAPISPRTMAMMASSIGASPTTILYGGYSDVAMTAPMDDTYTWDPAAATWVSASLHGAPGARGSSAISFDPVSTALVIFGGAGSNSTTFDWEQPYSNASLAPSSPTPPTCCLATNIGYYNGPVVQQAQVHVIVIQPSGATIPASYATVLPRFIVDYGNSAIADGLTQYHDTNRSIAFQNTGISGADYYVDTTLRTSTTLYANDIYDEVHKVIMSQHWGEGLSNLFFLYLPKGYEGCLAPNVPGVTQECAGGSGKDCGWHFGAPDPSTGKAIFYAVVGYEDAASNCDVNASSDQATANAVNTTSHEMSEMFTDPNGEGWCGAEGRAFLGTICFNAENGDRCNFLTPTSSGPDLFIGANSYRVQMEWSNRVMGCGIQ